MGSIVTGAETTPGSAPGHPGSRPLSTSGQTWYSGVHPVPGLWTLPSGQARRASSSAAVTRRSCSTARVSLYARVRIQTATTTRTRHGRPVDERRLHVEPRVHPELRPEPDRVGVRRRGRSSRRRGVVFSSSSDPDRIGERQHPVRRQGVHRRGHAAARPVDERVQRPDRGAVLQRDAGPDTDHFGGTAVRPDVVYVTWTRSGRDRRRRILSSRCRRRGRLPGACRRRSAAAVLRLRCVGGETTTSSLSPTVNPQTGFLYVAFENFENRRQPVPCSELAGAQQPVRSPIRLLTVFDLNYPRSGVNRQDSPARGQPFTPDRLHDEQLLRVDGGNVVIDRRGGALAATSTWSCRTTATGRCSLERRHLPVQVADGGSTWIGPTRVNSDRSSSRPARASTATAGRDCLRPRASSATAAPAARSRAVPGDFGADQWWPWVDINDFGHLNIIFHDRRLDVASVAHEWPTSRNRPGTTWSGRGVRSARSRTRTRATVLAAGSGRFRSRPGRSTRSRPGSGAGLDLPGQPAQLRHRGRAVELRLLVPRRQIFAGDYNNVAVTPNDSKAYGYWTDARNGRSSGGPAGGAGPQPGRNPICEQSDGFIDEYSSLGADAGQKKSKPEDARFLVTPCPGDGTP